MSWWLGRVMTNESAGQHGGGGGADGEDRRQRDAGVLQRAGAEGGDAVAELVGGDHQAGRGRRDGDEVLLGEADRERQQRRAAEPGEPEGEHAGDGAAVGQGGDGHEGGGEHERQQSVGAVAGEAALDRGEQDPPDGDHRPERGEGDGGDGRRGADLGGHVELRPVAVQRLADAVEHGERGVQRRTGAGSAPAAGRLAAARLPVCSGRRPAGDMRPASRIADSTGRPHQKPRPTKIATKTGASAVPSPSRALSTRTDRSTAVGMERRGERVEGRHGEPEPDAEEGRGHEQQAVGEGVVVGERCAGDEQAHRHEAGRQPGEVDALGSEAAGQAGAEQRRRRSR